MGEESTFQSCRLLLVYVERGGGAGNYFDFRLWLMQFVVVWYFVINQRVYTVQ